VYHEPESTDVLQMHLPSELEDKLPHLQIKEDDIIEDRNWLGYYKVYTKYIINWDTFLDRSFSGYKRFFEVCALDRGQNGVLEPTYAMDLFWHCHMFHPLEYNDLCVKHASRLIVHIPWPKDMTVNEMFDNLDHMDERWQQQFGESMHAICLC